MDINMFGISLHWFIFLQVTLIGQLTCANILDVTCINFNPIYDTSSSASYAAILNGADVTSMVSFQRSVDLDTGDRQSTWCSLDDNAGACGLPQGSTIDASGRVTFQSTDQDKFGAYGCRAERYNWTTETSTIFIRNDAHFTPDYFTVTVSLDEEVRLVMTPGLSSGTGSLEWILNHEDGGQTDLFSSVSGDALYISRAKKADHAGVHHYYYSSAPDRGGLVKLIVRACLDNLWGPGCQYTCPTCYNGGVCDDVSGRCVCPPGFSGDHCQIACEAGKFGQGCSGSCTNLESGRIDCSGAVFCLPDPYGCSCAAGWTGLQCDQACPDGSYGAGCTETCHCDSTGSCDPCTGACSNGCEDGWIGDQCQVTILDMTSVLRQGGVYNATTGDNFLGIYMIGDSSVTIDPSLTYYIGREVDTGPGETGHGAYLKADSGEITLEWEETGLPPETWFYSETRITQRSLRAGINQWRGGDARVGAYRMSVDYMGWTERNVMLNEYRGDSNSEVWPEKLSITVGIGETVTLGVSTTQSVDTSSLRWRLNGGSEITEWDGLTSVTIYDVRKSDNGIYECYVEGNRETGKHAILKLIVRSCPSSKYGLDCSQNCPVCFAGGVCHDVTGECVCRSGFQGVHCETPCGFNNWGKSCTVTCTSNAAGCQNRLFSPPNPVGMACINGYGGNRCQIVCTGDHFGASCEMDCNCDGTCNRVNGCEGGQCSDSYEGNFCQALRSDLSCPTGYFGTLCSYPCHCAGDVVCQRTNGHCPNGVTCAEEWAGSDCQQALPRLLESPWVFDITKESVLLIWNAWTDGYDYGNGPVHSYQIDYTWKDDKDNTGESEVPLIIIGDSTAEITDLFGFRDYNFYVSVRREVEGQVVAGVRSGPISAKPDCGAPLLEPEILSTTVNGIDSFTVEWKIPDTPSSSWLQCDSSMFSYNLTYWPRVDPTNSTTIPVYSTADIVIKTVVELDVCTEYEISIVVVNSIDLAGPADQTTAMTEKIPPQPVDSADVTSDSYNHLEITWSVPFSQCGGPSYNVSRRLLLIDQCDDSMADTVTWEVTGDTSIEYDDLVPYSTYEFTVLATLEGYDAETVYVIAYNSTESVSTAPPEDFTVDNTVKGKLDYTWSSPPCGDRNGAVSYDYEFGEAGGDDVQRENLIVTSKSFEDLKHYMMYEFTVCPRTVVGPGPCIFIQTRTLPSEPTGPLNVESDLGSTNQTYTIIAWEKPELINGLFLRYEIQKDNDDVIMIVEEEERIYSFSDLEPNQEYAIKVRAVSSGGNGAWDSVDVTTLPIPEPNTPEVPVTTAKNDTSISIEWPLVDDTNLGIYRITNYTVRYSSATGDEDTIDVNYITSPMVCTIAPLEPGTEYYIKVRAVNEGGPGGWSESLTESTDQTFTTCPDHFLVPGVQIGLIVVVVVILLYAVAVTFLLIQLRRKGPIRTEENGQDPYMDLRPRSEADNIYQEIAITSTTSSQKPGERRLPSSDLFHKNQNVEQFANTTQDDAGYEFVLTPN